MQRKEKEIADRAAMEEILQETPVCRIAFADNNEPYLIPVCFGYEKGAIYFHSALSGKKIDMIQKNPRCCVEADMFEGPVRDENPCRWTMRYRSVICTGQARILKSHEEKCAAMNCILQHYGGPSSSFSLKSLEQVCLVQIAVEEMTGKQSGY